MKNMGIQKLTEELKRLNPSIDVCFKADIYPAIIIVGCSDCAQLEETLSCATQSENKLLLFSKEIAFPITLKVVLPQRCTQFY